MGVIYAVMTAMWASKQDAGSAKMQEISNAVKEGAYAFLAREYKTGFGDGAGGLFFSAPDPLLLLRQATVTDAAVPAGVAVAVEVLLRLGAATGEARHGERARERLNAVGGSVAEAPLGCASLLSAGLLLAEAGG